MSPKKMSARRTPLTLAPDWKPHEHTCIQGKVTCFMLDADKTHGSCLIKTGENASLFIDSYGNVGINTTQPTAQLDIVSDNGACLRMRHSKSNAECDQFIDSSGNLTIDPDGVGVTITKSLNIVAHTGGISGLYLRGRLVTSNADQLNFTNTTIGVAQANKALIADANLNINGINQLTLNTPLGEISGGTGYKKYTAGDILVATDTQTLTKLPVSINNGDMLMCDPVSDTKITWSAGVFRNYIDMALPTWVARGVYNIQYIYAKTQTDDIIINDPTMINSNNFSTLNGTARSDTLSGQVNLVNGSINLEGVRTVFTIDFIEGDVITINDESRMIKIIESDTSLIIAKPFSMDGEFDFQRGGCYGIAYLYALSGPTNGFLLSHRSPDQPLVDIPCRYNSYRPIRFFIAHQQNEIITRVVSPNQFVFTPMYRLAINASNINAQMYDLSMVIPKTCIMIDLLITHGHTASTPSMIMIGDSNNMLQYCLPMSTEGIQQMIVSVPIINSVRIFMAYVTTEQSRYSIELKGFSVG